jgi:hypothetical protein
MQTYRDADSRVDRSPRRRRSGGRLDGPLLRPEQAAELLAVKPSWIYEAVRVGRLRPTRFSALIH